jgi:hypothetical protein
MKMLAGSLFGLVLVASAPMWTTTDALADPGENNGNHYGQIRNGNNGNGGAVPIDGTTLALFGVGFAGLVAWQVLSRRKIA